MGCTASDDSAALPLAVVQAAVTVTVTGPSRLLLVVVTDYYSLNRHGHGNWDVRQNLRLSDSDSRLKPVPNPPSQGRPSEESAAAVVNKLRSQSLEA